MLEKWDTTFRSKVINEAKHLTQSIELRQLLKAAEKLTETDETTWDSDMASLLLLLHVLPPNSWTEEDQDKPHHAAAWMNTFGEEMLIPCQSTSSLGAFDELFKSHYVFNLSYDEYLGQVFTFVKTTVYNRAATISRQNRRLLSKDVDEFVLKRGSCTPQMAGVLTESILNMLVNDMRPLSMVEDEGFKQMVNTFHSAVTQRRRQYLDLKSDQWTLLEELAQALQAFECATVYLSGESYVTVSALPPLVKGLLKSTQTVYDTAPVQAFQAAASEETTARWSGVVTFAEDIQSKQIIAAALDPRFRKLKFLTPDERFSVQNKVQALALKPMDGSTVNQLTSGNQDATASANKGSPNRRTVSVLDSLLGSDSTDSDNDNNEVDAQNQMISNEVLIYFYSL
ncbi:unnamed protein product [Pleuronectes platessa]|uniref:Uncharacterized protein n=1 Tax=Pleuronectes platessa TaxID=8262 RepID=A0A9N7VDW0_PLEPL|nr:unnamed protein product [Pleuronectes platessa]